MKTHLNTLNRVLFMLGTACLAVGIALWAGLGWSEGNCFLASFGLLCLGAAAAGEPGGIA